MKRIAEAAAAQLASRLGNGASFTAEEMALAAQEPRHRLPEGSVPIEVVDPCQQREEAQDPQQLSPEPRP